MIRTDFQESHEAMDLLARIRAGSLQDWHRFIDCYSPVIYRVIRRYLAASGYDPQRTMFVQVLESLYRGRLYEYKPRCRLSTWLFIYTRSRCLDFLRSQRGRHVLPGWLKGLPELDRQVYRLYYLHGLGAREVCRRLSSPARTVTLDHLAESLDRLDQHVDDRARRRMAFDLQARSTGVVSGRLLDYLHRLRVEYELADDATRPDFGLLQGEISHMLARVRGYVERLPDLERQVIALRYYEGLTAKRTAETLRLEGQRKVYTLEGQALRRLRSMLSA